MFAEFGKAVGDWIIANVGWTVVIILAILSLFFKIPKKEVHLWTWLLSKLGDALLGGVRKDIKDLRTENSDMFSKLKDDTDTRITKLEENTKKKFDEIVITNNNNCKTMQDRLDEIEKKQDMQTADRIRTRVLNFAEDLRRGNSRTKEDFDLLLREHDLYSQLVAKHKIENNVYEHAIKFVNKKYDEFMDNDSFARY